MSRRAFWIGGWAALVSGALAAVAAAAVIVIGVLALSGQVTYPVDINVGPFSVHDRVSMPVAARADVCPQIDAQQQAPTDCLRFSVRGENGRNADVRATTADLTGTVDLATTGGWSAVVVASVARKAIGLMVIGAVLLLLWRLLANSAAGEVFSARAVRHVRGIGWLLIGGGLVNGILGLVVSAAGGYEIVQVGAGPHLERIGEAGIEPAQLALGVLILLLAEAFRHGAAVEAERRLTI